MNHGATNRSVSQTVGQQYTAVQNTNGGFYFVRAMKLYSDICLLNGKIREVIFETGRGGKTLTPQIVPFSVSVLAVDTNKVETATLLLQFTQIADP